MACHCLVVLAETVQIDTGTVVLILVIFGLIVAAGVAIVVLGFVLAPRAGRGSSAAMGWWLFALSLEVLWCVGSLSFIVRGEFTVWVVVPPVLLAAQLALYFQAKRDAGR